ncbi:hypothetical protein OUZ56_018842 [Daphnia magna]|uniref:Uncharacterized protein n=1 Tax=Daphnia magna TaxID=35525 RepID=A0ABQ9Z9Z0_9CRUS|nr:hypothetical protein OUZ56_018842 [Daphnia magna]
MYLKVSTSQAFSENPDKPMDYYGILAQHGLTLEVAELSSARPVLGCSSAIFADSFWGTR